MRQYLIDQLRPEEVERVRAELDRACEPAEVGGLYWLEVPEDLLGPEQFAHRECRPHCLAVEVGRDRVSFELLVRSRKKLRCACIAYATPQQRTFLLGFADRVLEAAGVKA
ncbi:hypothetical protein G3N55_10835 [Dissulfurirhabdus thermomarina]|uniref:Uncharacterized protein n=1 Tax=Dissulfurirhabdus thermomarina TaxID=1765737 RepID=A0A6N9TTB7_DISTH|nr:hypothetical protein [Dissulfurirhabdus thermomarina]NDY43333.1 hypothetical protein [Dissulfurirhabdus thermomarina]NMX22844.1 hypothetical protein [Dissulfurirhabdus thermomarina]